MNAQKDTVKYYLCTPNCYANKILQYLEKDNLSKDRIFEVALYISYFGNDKCANELMNLYINKNDSITASDWHRYSVQNTKHGNYSEATKALAKAVALNPKEIAGYYGWVLLYYYRDYEKALKYLNQYDELSPETEAPVGENIHFLKGLCFYQLQNYEKAIDEFKLNETFEVTRFKKKNTNPYIDFYVARCYDKIVNLKAAKRFYKRCIKYSRFPTEAHFYLGQLLQKQQKTQEAKEQLSKALSLIKQGYKQQDIYVELFDEVYQTQIEEALSY